MSTLEEWTLLLHTAAGIAAILAGCAALVTSKGRRRHRRAGTVFVVSMGIVVVSVFALVGINPTPFRIILTLVAIFSGYFAFSGYRVLSRKRPVDETYAIDWIAAGSVVFACLGLALWGIDWFADGKSFGVVMIVFGGIGLTFGLADVRAFRAGGEVDWMITHLQRMVAAFIATVSAASAVNLTPLLGVTAWLWPTLVGVPLIVYWSNRYAA